MCRGADEVVTSTTLFSHIIGLLYLAGKTEWEVNENEIKSIKYL